MTQEEIYRRQARLLLEKRNQAKRLFHEHRPSIGYAGEHILRRAFKKVLPKEFDVCQGFVYDNKILNEKCLSRQCDVIIYRKGNGAVKYSVGDLKVIKSCHVVAVIEVKSSIKKESFFTTLDALEKLEKLGVRNTFIFIFGSLTANTLSGWLWGYKRCTTNDVTAIDTSSYDWSDKEWLPNSILSLESLNYFVLDHIQDENNDCLGYVSYKITDKGDEEISCLQEFFATIMNLLNGTLEINQNDYSIKDGFTLWRF